MTTANTKRTIKEQATELVEKANDSFLPTVAVTGVTYAALELLNHGVIQTYVMSYVTGLGLSASVATGICYGLVFIGVVGVGYLIYRFFVKPIKEAHPIRTVTGTTTDTVTA